MGFKPTALFRIMISCSPHDGISYDASSLYSPFPTTSRASCRCATGSSGASSSRVWTEASEESRILISATSVLAKSTMEMAVMGFSPSSMIFEFLVERRRRNQDLRRDILKVAVDEGISRCWTTPFVILAIAVRRLSTFLLWFWVYVA